MLPSLRPRQPTWRTLNTRFMRMGKQITAGALSARLSEYSTGRLWMPLGLFRPRFSSLALRSESVELRPGHHREVRGKRPASKIDVPAGIERDSGRRIGALSA